MTLASVVLVVLLAGLVLLGLWALRAFFRWLWDGYPMGPM